MPRARVERLQCRSWVKSERSPRGGHFMSETWLWPWGSCVAKLFLHHGCCPLHCPRDAGLAERREGRLDPSRGELSPSFACLKSHVCTEPPSS